MAAVQKDVRRALDQARKSFAERAWAKAFAAFSRADDETPLQAEDLELLAMAAYLIGRDDDYLSTLERAYNAHLDAGQCASRRPLRVLARLSPAHARRDGPRDRLVCARSAAAGARRARMRRARLPAAAGRRAAPWSRATSRPLTPLQLRPPPSASAAATRTWLPVPATSRAGLGCSRGKSKPGSRSWTRPWSRSPPASCRPS